MSTEPNFIMPLSEPTASLEQVGGKGASLARMAAAGLPVPGGFYITTEAYRYFVKEQGLQEQILGAVSTIDLDHPGALEEVSSRVNRLFTQPAMPEEIAGAICRAYAGLGSGDVPVAVRSSATAEDLPGASFAGQQETYLNIRGAEAVLEAVKKCWVSLWTARAIAYRARQGIAPESVALAVVVQELVSADAAGVMFTANPVSGSRGELMITAAWGLGEAIVSGLVTPDTLEVDKATGKVTRRETSEKQVMTVRTGSGTAEQPVPPYLRNAPVLSGDQAAELAKLGVEIERLYGMPMDIEWALEGGRFAILQARPVTALGEAPAAEPPLVWARANPKATMMRGSFAEFVPEPVSPLFATLAVPIAQEATQKMMGSFFEDSREFGSSYVYEVVNGYVYTGMLITPGVLWKMITLALFKAKEVFQYGQLRWATVRARSRELAERWQSAPAGPVDLAALPATELLAGVREIFHATAEYYSVAQSGPIGAAMTSEMIFGVFYRALVRRKSDPELVTFLLGLETLPLRAEKSLYDLAMWVKEQPELVDYLQRVPVESVCAALKTKPVPAPLAGAFAERLNAYLSEFGHVIYNLDFSKPVPADDPAPVLEGLKAYAAGQAGSPYERQRAQANRREKAEQATLARLDPLRRKWFARLLKWARETGPERENCIADLGLGYPQLRGLLSELGRRLADGGAIAQAADIYWLEAQEANELAARLDHGEPLPVYVGAVECRKAFWQRVRSVNPPVSMPEKTIFSKLLPHENQEGSHLKGYPASPGVVTARACVLRGPEEFSKMQPGDVIVAITTTPAWTPLFAMASAVVTDIGGPLSHSSIVAREYGIPAVMATGSASRRISHGQVITVDGTAGIVRLISGS